MLRVFFNASVLFPLLNVHPHAGMLLCWKHTYNKQYKIMYYLFYWFLLILRTQKSIIFYCISLSVWYSFNLIFYVLCTKLLKSPLADCWRSQAVDALIVLCTFKGTTYLLHPADSVWYELPSISLFPEWSRFWGADAGVLFAASAAFVFNIWLRKFTWNYYFFPLVRSCDLLCSVFLLPFSLIGFTSEMCVFALRVFLGVLLCAPHLCSECPSGCECFAVTRTVKCVSKDLLAVPQSVPGYARTVFITGNDIHQIGPDSFAELENVTNIILSNSRWDCRLFFASCHSCIRSHISIIWLTFLMYI